MTLRTSNERALTILPPTPVVGIGWTVRFLSETDFQTVLAHTNRWSEASFSDELNEVGAFALTMAVDDPIFTNPLPNGEPGDILSRECVVQFLYEGVVRFEGLLEDVQPDEVAKDGTERVTLSGRGVAAMLERAIVLPEGMPTPVTFAREFTGASMAAWLTLFEEAQARGIADRITPAFTATKDAYLEPWGETALRTVQAGTDLLSLLNTFCETNDYAWTIANPYRKLVVAKNLGQRLADKVIFYRSRHLLESQRKATRREIKTVIFAQAGDYALASASGNEARWGRREKWVTAGGAGDISTAQAVATAEARISGDEKISRTAKILFDESPGRRPFEDYRVGDWVGVETSTGSVAEVRIVAMALRIDDAGNADSEVTLQSRFESEEIRVRRQLERLNASGLTDAGGAPITIVQAVNGTVNLTDLKNVSPTAAADGDVLTWDAGTSQWRAEGIPYAAVPRTLTVALTDETTTLSVGTGKLSMRAPTGMILTAPPRASLAVAGSSGVTTVDIKVSGVSVLTAAKLNIDATEKTSTTAATPAALASVTVPDDAEIVFDVTAAGTGAKGLKVTLYYREA